jgi:hypothetical protein
MKYETSFREEIIATALLMGVVITGSFLLVYRSIHKDPESLLTVKNEEAVLGKSTEEDAKTIKDAIDTAIEEVIPTPTPKPVVQKTTPSSSQSATMSPLYNTSVIEQPYGTGGEYDTTDYRLTLINPRLVIGTTRTFRVDVILANKSVQQGLKNRLSALIIKEGDVIAESAPFSVSESATVMPGEQITYTATMSLISGTDVARIKYLPLVDGIPETIHDL